MKIDFLIVQQLFKAKKVSLQNVGTFFLASDIVLPLEEDKAFALPENAVRFEFDKRAPQDDDLVGYIMERTKKMRPLATSDLESYTLFIRQFINIGKPISIEGLGVLQKDQQGNYEFVPGIEIHPRAESQPAPNIKEKNAEDINFSVTRFPPPRKTKWGWIGLLLFFVAVAASVYFYQQNQKSGNSLQKIVPVADTGNSKNIHLADSSLHIDSLAKLRTPALITETPADSFHLVFKSFQNMGSASLGLSKFRSYGHAAQLHISKDSTKFELYLSFPKMGTDTSRLIDSISKFFDTRAYLIN